MNNYYKNKVSWCPICEQGWVQIVKEKESGQLFVWCDECDSEWPSPNDVEHKEMATRDTYAEIEDPTDNEIIVKGWETFIIRK
jgi:hypothetical protein